MDFVSFIELGLLEECFFLLVFIITWQLSEYNMFSDKR